MSQVPELLIGIAVLALIMYRNLVARAVRQRTQRIFLILGIIGIIETVQYLQKNHVEAAVGVAALAGSLVLAAAFGAIRAATVRVWMKDGQPWSQGSWITAGLWIVALAAHLGYDALIGTHKDISGLGSATLVLYLAVSLAVQWLIVSARAARLDPAGAGQVGWTP